MPIIKLETSDRKILDVDVHIAKCSTTLSFMLDLFGTDNHAEDEVVPLPNIHSATLRKVLEWGNYHKDDPPLPEDNDNTEKRTDDILPWDANFLKVDLPTLYELILAANYLDIKGLADAACKTIANMIKNKTSEEIRKTFGIENDFTAAEEEKIRAENKWCEEN